MRSEDATRKERVYWRMFRETGAPRVTEEDLAYFRDHPDEIDEVLGVGLTGLLYVGQHADEVNVPGGEVVELLGQFPEGYRHLAYLQSKNGFEVRGGLPGLRGPELQTLYSEGKAWLAGSGRPGEPL